MGGSRDGREDNATAPRLDNDVITNLKAAFLLSLCPCVFGRFPNLYANLSRERQVSNQGAPERALFRNIVKRADSRTELPFSLGGQAFRTRIAVTKKEDTGKYS